MMTILRPTTGRLVVRKLPDETMTKGGIYIPATTGRETPCIGEVVAIGPEYLTESGDRVPFVAGADEQPIKVGDQVLYPRSSGMNLKLGEQEFVHLDHTEVLHVAIEVDPDCEAAKPWLPVEEPAQA